MFYQVPQQYWIIWKTIIVCDTWKVWMLCKLILYNCQYIVKVLIGFLFTSHIHILHKYFHGSMILWSGWYFTFLVLSVSIFCCRKYSRFHKCGIVFTTHYYTEDSSKLHYFFTWELLTAICLQNLESVLGETS